MRTWRGWLFVLGLALVVRALVGLVLLREMPLVHDAQSYADFALELLTSFPGDKAYYWPPGNSMLLAGAFAVFGASVWVARVAMLVVSLASVVFSALLARELDVRGTGTSERVTAYFAAAYVPSILLVGQTYAQHLAALTMLSLAYFGLRAAREARLGFFAVAGIAFGVGCLTRPSMVSVAPVFLVVWIAELARHRREQTKSGTGRMALGAAFFVAAFAAIVIPIELHNRAHGAGLAISTNNERNLFLGNNPYTPDYKTSHLGQRSMSELDPETRAYLESFYTRPDERSAMEREVVSYVFHHPIKTAHRTVNRFAAFWGFDYLGSRIVQEWNGWSETALAPLLALEAGAYCGVIVLAILGLLAFRDETERFWRRTLVAIALAYEVPYMIAFSGGTYHFPVMGLLMPFAGIAGARLLRRGGLADTLARARACRSVWVALTVFVVIQTQYAYYTVAMKDDAWSVSAEDREGKG